MDGLATRGPMVAYNFQKRFAPLVESGEKRQTIRPVGKRRHARPGDALQLYTGMRTKSCRKLRDETCKTIEPIVINPSGDIYISEGLVTNPIVTAKRDGFETVEDFIAFFRDTHGLPFQGFLVRW